MPRPRKPDALHRLRGNPSGKAGVGDWPVPEQVIPFPRKVALEIPDFLTDERERQIFKLIIEDYLQRRVARAPDFHSFGRWAHFMHRWVCCKEQLEGKATWFQYETAAGKQIRRHPLFRDMLDIEVVLERLEDRLGLNPTARHNILRGLTAMPAAMGGDIFADDDKQQPETIEAPPVSPLGFLTFTPDDDAS